VPVGEAAPPALWLEKPGEWFSGDAASIAGLQEWMGYLLTADTSLHKILFVVGSKRSGKGTIINTVTELAGAANVAATNFVSLGSNFGLQPLVGKRIAVMPDARLACRADQLAALTERLLSISGEDAQTVNRKNMRE